MIIFGVLFLVVLSGGLYYFNNKGDSGEFNAVAQCLTDKGTKMYGAYWCGHCATQKDNFGSSFKYIDYVECADPSNPNVQTAVCTAAEIKSYPTWVFADGTSISGEQPVDSLAKIAGC